MIWALAGAGKYQSKKTTSSKHGKAVLSLAKPRSEAAASTTGGRGDEEGFRGLSYTIFLIIYDAAYN
ncbi:MAG: hypothetical protein A3E37_05445 [Candidatus Andersenbacteria bacterium RIFCSPHIGHO2_12_FULL_46_9]|nr:MAG: hypothetical protein A3B76_05820 [Candidatus Andersenbacteria bacterium RIFCSPHIGHO2_02_FULL_46_16]OGY35695.1 MAG: hypothetical protein A3E37_05445 [Candidatus Andersenbacteria bacterium RIFCSPHIGHO2_12_FULL_46_9]OGY38089.1 MAG: hypothetical protein A3I08_04675 [Candidatus Andersenbacteria bacterium RIFCSPLOWO2_02_FULL_46_11]